MNILLDHFTLDFEVTTPTMGAEQVSSEMKEVLELEKCFLIRHKGEVSTLDRIRLRRKLLAVHQVMLEILEKQPDEDEAMAHDDGTQWFDIPQSLFIDEATMPSDDEDPWMGAPRIQWGDEEPAATCLRCGFEWDGDAQHVQCDE